MKIGKLKIKIVTLRRLVFRGNQGLVMELVGYGNLNRVKERILRNKGGSSINRGRGGAGGTALSLLKFSIYKSSALDYLMM